MLFLFKDVKFTVDGSTFITPSTKNFCLMLYSCASRLKQYCSYLGLVSGSTQCKEITEINIY